MAKQMTTDRSPQELAYVHYWRSRGYRVGPGDPVPLDTRTPPGAKLPLHQTHPVIDALLGAAVMALFMGVLMFLWIKTGAGL